MDNEKRLSKWILPTIIVASVLLLCSTILAVAFKRELIYWYRNSKARSAERYWKEKSRKEMFLQFSKKEQNELSAIKGTVSVTEKPLNANFPYAWLGRPLANPLPEDCFSASGDHLAQMKLHWEERGYDGFQYCNLKDNAFTWNSFLKTVILFTEKGLVKRIRCILEFENLMAVKKEYSALSYDLANKYGLPIKEEFEIHKGYEESSEAYDNKRVRAFRTFQAKDCNITIGISKSNSILIEYYFPKKRNENEKEPLTERN